MEEQKKERLQKIIANSGFCSRREAERLILKGRVFLNNKLAEIGNSASKTDEIRIGKTQIKRNIEYKYLILNKPRGVVTALGDEFEKSVLELLPISAKIEKLYPCGRLDKNAEGLIIFTNNGDIANKIMHPSYELEKIYLVKTYDIFKKDYVNFVNKFGIFIKDGFVEPKINTFSPKTFYIKIHVGFHKVVKKIFDKFGIRVQSLIRLQVGPIKLGKLKKGEYRYLNQKEIESFEKKMNNLTSKKVNKKNNFEKSKISEKEFKKLNITIKKTENKKH